MRAEAVRAGMTPEAIQVFGMDIGATIDAVRAEVRPGDLVLLKGAAVRRFRRIALTLMQRDAACRVKRCNVKVPGCEDCPLLAAEPSAYRNHFIRRYLEP
jgi:hypothetical protein